jgi:hypothetical protein
MEEIEYNGEINFQNVITYNILINRYICIG